MDLSFLSQFIDANKLGGWVRAGVASLLAVAIGKFPGLSTYLDPSTQTALGVVAAGIVVGVWSQLTKTDSAKLAAVEAMPEVKKIQVSPIAAGALADAVADTSRPKVTT